MILNLLRFFVILVITSLSAPADANCNRVCKGSSREIPVRYPFGFSDGCEIRLNCSDTGIFIIGGKYQVLDLTSDYILIKLPAKCDRAFKDIRQLRTNNYALTWRNGLLLGNCSSTLNDCVVSTSIIEGHFNLPSCESTNGSLNCYSDDTRDPVEFMNLIRLEMAGCRVLYSSITFDFDRNTTQNSSVSMGFQSMELGWWVEGDCYCHQKAVCKNVSIDDARVGYRCHCIEGYDGDGFGDGDGCRRGVVAGASLVSIIALICYCIRKRTIFRNQMSAKRLVSEATGSFNVPFYSHKEIERATNGFSEKLRLGVGAYGTVYAGKLNNEGVAIKKIRHIDSYGMDQIGKGRVDEIIDPFLEANGETWTVSSIHKVAELAFRCLAFHGDMRPSMMEVAEELEQIRVSGWAGTDDSINIASLSVASSSPYNGSENAKGGGLGSQRLVIPSNCLSKTNEKDRSPDSVQEAWLSEQNSPSANSLLNNIF
ncbi:Green fluorescent protein-like protein, partial [Cynara cardunculus var. scolymus]